MSEDAIIKTDKRKDKGEDEKAEKQKHSKREAGKRKKDSGSQKLNQPKAKTMKKK